jgi:hypothetical protein
MFVDVVLRCDAYAGASKRLGAAAVKAAYIKVAGVQVRSDRPTRHACGCTEDRRETTMLRHRGPYYDC